MAMSNHSAPRRELPSDLADALREEDAVDRASLERAWQLSGVALRNEPTDEDLRSLGEEIWSALEPAVRNAPRPPRTPASRRSRPAWRWSALLATFVLLFFGGLFYLTAESTYRAAPGERLTLTLPDGSRVELNSGASLSFAPRTFGWRSRTTTLEGEAFFEVLPDDSEFITRTYNAEVRVLGTSFNVRAWPGEKDGGTVVALRTGRVLLSGRGHDERVVVLNPGQMSRVYERNAAPTHPEATDLRQATAWRTGRLVFVDEPLRVILADMERRFGVVLRADSDEILQDRLTLAYDDPADVEMILADITSSYSRYRYRRISGGYELYMP